MAKNLQIELIARQRDDNKRSKIERQLSTVTKNRFRVQEILAKEHIENSELKMALADEYVKKYGKVKNLYVDGALFALGVIIVATLVNQF